MISTYNEKINLGQKVFYPLDEETQIDVEDKNDTCGQFITKNDLIKMISESEDKDVFSGYERVNFTEEKIEEAYRRINKILGGD